MVPPPQPAGPPPYSSTPKKSPHQVVSFVAPFWRVADSTKISAPPGCVKAFGFGGANPPWIPIIKNKTKKVVCKKRMNVHFFDIQKETIYLSGVL